ncbi:MAG TPA: hypothetical protein VKH37_11180, partial [Ferruginibacter sp.]|nr:hypothetical protein [Ferruginibacter sp.]
EWDNIELVRGTAAGSYKVVFSSGSRKVTYKVKPVLEGKDFDAAEKLYQEKMKQYSAAVAERKKREEDEQKLSAQTDSSNAARDEVAKKTREEENKAMEEENKKIEELNKLITIRNNFIRAENIKTEALIKERKRQGDAAMKANKELEEKQRTLWERNQQVLALETNLVRSFQIDGFGYWNCDQPTLPATEQYAAIFTTTKNEPVLYANLCMAAEGINRVQNYYNTKNIGLIAEVSYYGWAYTTDQFYYFTAGDYNHAIATNNPKTIAIRTRLYEGDLKDYAALKRYLFQAIQVRS